MAWVSIESSQWEGERIISGMRVETLLISLENVQLHPWALELTIVHNGTWDAQHFFDFGKGIDNTIGVGEITRDVQLFVCAVCSFGDRAARATL